MKSLFTLFSLVLALGASKAQADESLFGAIRGAETLPQDAHMFTAHAYNRFDKGAGKYNAKDYRLEVSTGLTNKLTGSVYVMGMGLNTNGIRVDGYIPTDNSFGLKVSGFEGALKYNFLSTAMEDFGLSTYLGISQMWVDPHSGHKKNKTSGELHLLAQKYLLDGQFVLIGNIGVEATHATRGAISGLPDEFEWPTFPEMEIGLKAGLGGSYRFASNLYLGFEGLYDEEHETEVGRERWSVQMGPNIHYGGKRWWATLTWLRQIRGGGEGFPEQEYKNLHLIEKTRDEIRLKAGFSF